MQRGQQLEDVLTARQALHAQRTLTGRGKAKIDVQVLGDACREVQTYEPRARQHQCVVVPRVELVEPRVDVTAYRRHDEVGTPICITVDFQTIEDDDTVTVRDRDTMDQKRVDVGELADYVTEYLR